MPRLWTETIEDHRREVRDAILDAAARLAGESGLLSLTMSDIADRTGIGRATLYKYFPDVESILLAWHERGIATHLQQLADVRDKARGPLDRLEAVLEAYAFIEFQHHGSEEHHGHLQDRVLAGLLHRGPHVARAQEQLRAMLRELVAEAAQTGDIRADIAPDELAGFCLHALSAASGLASKPAVRRLVSVVLTALRPAPGDS